MTSKISLFECNQCGDCCKGFGGTYLSDMDIQAIADYIGECVETFKNRYCEPSGGRLVLSQGKDDYCIFYSNNCTIHPVKPRMCRRWPFIDSLLVDTVNWHIMAASCPGMRTNMEEKQLGEQLQQILAPPENGS